MIDEVPSGWELERTNLGGSLIRHRHDDQLAVCYMYGNPDRTWAECTMCGAVVDLELATEETKP